MRPEATVQAVNKSGDPKPEMLSPGTWRQPVPTGVGADFATGTVLNARLCFPLSKTINSP